MREDIIQFTLSKILEERKNTISKGYVFMWNITFKKEERDLLEAFGYKIIHSEFAHEHSEYVIFQEDLKDKSIDEINKISYQKKLDRETKLKENLNFNYEDLLLLTSYFRKKQYDNQYESDETALNKYLNKSN